MSTHELAVFAWKNECALLARPPHTQDKPRKSRIFSDRPIDVAGERWHASKEMLVNNRASRSFG